MTVSVGTLRLRNPVPDSPAERLRTIRALQAADLTPAGLPPSAVLIVRRLADPLPRRFGGGRLRPRPEWECAVRSALGEAARAAARPDRSGRVPANAEAVLFEDEAELVACLVADRLGGRAASRWWWRALVSRVDLPRWIATEAGRDPGPILIARPREVPAVLTRLVRWGQADALASCLPEPLARRALAAVALAHDLPPTLAGVTDGRRREARPPDRRVLAFAGRRADPSREDAPAASPAPAPPWNAWLPQALRRAGRPPAVRALFGVSLCLHAAPSRLRSEAARQQAERWWAWVAATPSAVSSDPLETRLPTADARDREAPEATRRERHVISISDAAAGNDQGDPPASVGRSAMDPIPPVDDGSLIAASGATPPMLPSDVSASRWPRVAAPPALRREIAAAADAERTSPGTPADEPSPPERPGAAAAETEETERAGADTGACHPAAWPGDAIETRVGGAFYLIQALEHLGLPDAFEASWGLATAAGAWGTLDLMARALLGARFERVARDPLWEAFGRLGGRTGGRTRRHGGAAVMSFASASDPPYRVPARWPSSIGDPCDQISWCAAHGRIWLWSRRGYLLAHRAFRGPAPAAALRESRRLRDPARRPGQPILRPAREIPRLPPGVVPAGCPPRAARCVAAAAPFVARRLLLAVGRDAPDGKGRSRAGATLARLLEVPARVHVTSSHVDVEIDFQRVDLTVRRAGLDRDPGWLPAYGRVVYFHFD